MQRYIDQGIEVVESYHHTASANAIKALLYPYSSGHFKCNEKYRTTRSGQNNFLVIYTISGTGILDYENRIYELRAGDVFFIDCMEFQDYKTGDGGAWEFKWFHFSGANSREMYQLFRANNDVVVKIKNRDVFLEYFEQFKLPNSTMDIRLSCAIHKIVTEILVSASTSENSFFSVISYIENNYGNDIEVSGLADIAHLSKFYFIRKFKEQMGDSPYEYIIKKRINHAKSLLCRTDKTIDEISALCGFRDASNFIASFRRHTKTTPTKYRRLGI